MVTLKSFRQFTLRELATYDGRNGRPSYVAYKGMVYDVTGSFLWRGGRHQAMHRAGKDLTVEMSSAPHSADFLERFPVVGVLVREPD